MRREKGKNRNRRQSGYDSTSCSVIFQSNGYTVYTFTFEQDGHKYMVATSYKGGIAMVEIKD